VNTPDIVAATDPIVVAFERLGVDYSIAGSVASSAHGIARATLDVDLVADLVAANVDPLVSALEDNYYIDKDAALDAIRRRSMFNVIHLDTMLKVDIYVLTRRDFDRSSIVRHLAGESKRSSRKERALGSMMSTLPRILYCTSLSGITRVGKCQSDSGMMC
jgi:hypothetical protein